MKNLSYSVVQAGKTLKDVFTDVGNKIRERRSEIQAEQIMDEFSDPNRFIDPQTKQLKNPLSIQTDLIRGVTKLSNLGKFKEAAYLSELGGNLIKSNRISETNRFFRNVVGVTNPDVVQSFDNIDLNYADTDNFMKLLKGQEVDPAKVYTPNFKVVQDFTDPETNEFYPGLSVVQITSDETGKDEYKVLGKALDNRFRYTTSNTFSRHVDETREKEVKAYHLNGEQITRDISGTYWYMKDGKKDRIYTGDPGQLIPSETGKFSEDDAYKARDKEILYGLSGVFPEADYREVPKLKIDLDAMGVDQFMKNYNINIMYRNQIQRMYELIQENKTTR